MIAHNWLASRWRTIPGLPCPARRSMPCQAHHHLLRSHQAAPRPPMPPLAAPPPCCTTAALRLPAPVPPAVWCTSPPPSLPPPPQTLPPADRKGGVATPSTAPWKGGETFCKHANLAPCHPASNGGATLLPSARSWQCISNANSCQLLPTLANSRQSEVERTQRRAAEAMMDIKTTKRSLM